MKIRKTTATMTAEPESRVAVSVLTSVVTKAEGARTCIDASELEATSRGVDRTRDRRTSNGAKSDQGHAHPDAHTDVLCPTHAHCGRCKQRDVNSRGSSVSND